MRGKSLGERQSQRQRQQGDRELPEVRERLQRQAAVEAVAVVTSKSEQHKYHPLHNRGWGGSSLKSIRAGDYVDRR